MPNVLRIGQYRFFFYSNEGTPLKEAHIHVRTSEGEAKVSLHEPFAVLLNSGLTAQELRKITTMVKEKQDILLGAWHDYFA